MTKKEFRERYNYHVPDNAGESCVFCVYSRISDRPSKFVRFPPNNEMYPIYNFLCVRMGRKITTGHGCTCSLFERMS